MLSGSAAGQAQVYRCTAADGSIEFRQHPCADRQRSRRVKIEDTRTGWVPPKPKPESASDSQGPSERENAAARRRPARASDEHKYAERCWRKRQQIQRINNELRAGYRPARGERLKDRRRQYEAYVDEFCR
jgi:hypothetical protein